MGGDEGNAMTAAEQLAEEVKHGESGNIYQDMLDELYQKTDDEILGPDMRRVFRIAFGSAIREYDPTQLYRACFDDPEIDFFGECRDASAPGAPPQYRDEAIERIERLLRKAFDMEPFVSCTDENGFRRTGATFDELMHAITYFRAWCERFKKKLFIWPIRWQSGVQPGADSKEITLSSDFSSTFTEKESPSEEHSQPTTEPASQ